MPATATTPRKRNLRARLIATHRYTRSSDAVVIEVRHYDDRLAQVDYETAAGKAWLEWWVSHDGDPLRRVRTVGLTAGNRDQVAEILAESDADAAEEGCTVEVV